MKERTFRIERDGEVLDMTFAELRPLAPRNITDDSLRHRLWRYGRKSTAPIPMYRITETAQQAAQRSPWRNFRRKD